MPAAPNRARIYAKPGVLTAYCKHKNISLRRLSVALGVGPDTVYRVEQGGEPSPAFIAALMIETGAPFEDLFITRRSNEAEAS